MKTMLVKAMIWNGLAILAIGIPLNIPRANAQETAEAEAPSVGEESKELAKQATRQLQMGHVDDAIDLLESALEKDPGNTVALFLGGQAYSRKGVDVAATDRKAANEPLRRGAELMRKLVELKPELTEGEKEVLAISVYNEGCCFAIDGESDKALDRLEESIKLGFSDAKLLEADTDFESVRETERFKALLASLSNQPNNEDPEGDSEEDSEKAEK